MAIRIVTATEPPAASIVVEGGSIHVLDALGHELPGRTDGIAGIAGFTPFPTPADAFEIDFRACVSDVPERPRIAAVACDPTAKIPCSMAWADARTGAVLDRITIPALRLSVASL